MVGWRSRVKAGNKLWQLCVINFKGSFPGKGLDTVWQAKKGCGITGLSNVMLNTRSCFIWS